MNAISKRLLSWLCVIAMVLSFAPVMDLSGLAVKTQAAEEAAEIVYGSANFDGVDAAIIEQMNFGNGIDNSDENINAHIAAGTCPMCNATGITWTRKTAGFTFNDKEGETAHIYFDSEFTTTNNLVQMVNYPSDNDLLSKDGTICMALLSTAKVTCSKYRIQVGGTNNTLNIMGTGSIHADQSISAVSDLGLFQVDASTVNLYGGTFTHAHQGTDFRKAVIRIGGTSAVVNIFDGVKIGPETQDTSKVAQNVQYTQAGTVNMFGGEIRNGVSPAWGYAGNVTITQNGKFNMYGGTISNGTFLATATDGVTNNATIGGNVMVGGKYQETYYVNGSAVYTCSGGTLNMYGGTITDGKANNGGNGGGNICIYHGNGVMNMQGGTISNGYAKQDGGNIQCVSGILNVSGTALITGGECKIDGGNIHLDHASGTVNISGGKIADGEQTGSGSGGNIYVNKAKAFTLSGGIVDGGIAANNGANIGIGADNTVHSFTGGTVQNGIAAKQGGGISSSADLTLSGTNFVDNIGRTGGGNVNMAARELKLTITDGTISGGWVTGPWNETEQNYKPGGANWGGNVRAWACDVEITGGLIYGGVRGPEKSANAGNNVASLASVESTSTSSLNGASLTIGGDAVIVGDVNTSPASQNSDGTATCPGTTVTLKGAPKIVTRYELADGSTVRATSGGLQMSKGAVGEVKADISELTADAQIVFTSTLGKVLSVANENAANIVACCSMSNPAHVVSVNGSNELVVIEKPVEKPEKPVASEMGDDNWSDEAWDVNAEAKLLQKEMTLEKLSAHVEAGTCPICGTVEGGWVEATFPGSLKDADTKYHYYIDADTAITYNYNWACLYGSNQTMCFALLNGETEKQIDGLIAVRSGSTNSVVNIMGEGVIKNGDTMSDKLGLLRTQGTNPTMNIYGGTFYRTYEENASGQTAPKGALLVADAGTVNIFEGVTIGRAEQADTAHFNVIVKKATLNMYGGTIQNGRSNFGSSTLTNNYSGNVTLHESTSVFNMYAGTIKNGAYTAATTVGYGGNIAQRFSGATVNITGGTIENGSAVSYGGNIYGYGLNFTMSGGQFLGGSAPSGGSVVLGGASVAEISGYAKIANGQCTSETASDGGGNLKVMGTTQLTISGGLIADGSTYYGPNGDGKKADGTNIIGPCGGNVHINAATVKMTGGEISGGKSNSSTASGSIYITGNGKFEMSGGKVHGGRATYAGGGNIGVWKGTVELSGTAEVYDGFSNGAGGNISIASGNVTTNALTIKSGAKVYNGKAGATEEPVPFTLEELKAAVEAGTTTADKGLSTGKNTNGGNISMNGGTGSYATTLTIEEGAVVSGGLTSALVTSTITTNSKDEEIVKNTVSGGFGGNIYIAGANDVANIAGTVSGGSAYWGGNVGVDGGATVTITGTLDGGHAYMDGDHGGGNLAIEKGTVTTSGIIKNGTSDANGGNIHFKNDTSTLTISGGEITGGVADNQGGAIRGYNGHIYMTGGKIYGNTATNEVTDNVWCVRTHLTMSGDAQVIATEGVTRSAVSMIAYGGESATLTLADNASIIGANGAAVVQRAADTTAPSLLIKDGWAGTAYVNLDGTAYKPGNDIAVDRAIAVDADGNQGGAYTGSLYYGYDAVGALAKADGSLYLALAGVTDAEGNVIWHGSNDEALADYVHGEDAYVVLNGAADLGEDANAKFVIDLSGADLTLTGKGTVYGLDSSNDDYEGYKTVTVSDEINVALDAVNEENGNRYIAVQDSDNVWGFHRVEMVMTHVTLRAKEAGMYYKATYKCDDTLAANVTGFGVVLSRTNMPGADFMEETGDNNSFTMYNGDKFVTDDNHAVATTSGSVFNVIKEANAKEVNVANAIDDVYANLYFAVDNYGTGDDLNDDNYFVGDIVNGNTDKGVNYSLLEVLMGVEANWNSYSPAQKAMVNEYVMKWSGWITDEAANDWAAALPQIVSYQAS